jgi:hypothetical protein
MTEKISFCTTVMNRLDHLKSTLPQNIIDNVDYDHVEFVVLNYSSTDEIDLWIYEEMYEYIELGILKYCKVENYELYNRSHSRNLAMKCASGSILCNVDADNYIGKGYAYYLNEIFNANKNIFITVDQKTVPFDLYGRISFTKEDFLLITGYDEKMFGYGYEDIDIQERLINLGRKPIHSQNLNYLKAIEHSNSDRIENEYNAFNENKVFVSYINSYSSKIALLMKNNEFQYVEIVNTKYRSANNVRKALLNRIPDSDNIIVVNNKIHSGSWKEINNDVHFSYEFNATKNEIKIAKNANSQLELTANGETFDCLEITQNVAIVEMIRFFSESSNKMIMKNNMKHKITSTNDKEYGRGNIMVNFKTRIDI